MADSFGARLQCVDASRRTDLTCVCVNGFPRQKTKMTCFPMSVSAALFCPGCDVNRTSIYYGEPFSFLKGCKGTEHGSDHEWRLRSLPQVIEEMNYAFETIKTKKRRRTYLQRKGYRYKMQSVSTPPPSHHPRTTLALPSH